MELAGCQGDRASEGPLARLRGDEPAEAQPQRVAACGTGWTKFRMSFRSGIGQAPSTGRAWATKIIQEDTETSLGQLGPPSDESGHREVPGRDPCCAARVGRAAAAPKAVDKILAARDVIAEPNDMATGDIAERSQ